MAVVQQRPSSPAVFLPNDILCSAAAVEEGSAKFVGKGGHLSISDSSPRLLATDADATCQGNESDLDDDGLAAFEEAKSRAGIGLSTSRAGALVLANTLLGGSGMLGIPHALSVSGYGLGLLLIALFGAASAFGSHLLHVSARRIGRAPCSFYTVAMAVAPRWTWLIDSAVAIKCFGVATSYLIIVGDLLPDAMLSAGFVGFKRWHAITAGFGIAAPLACLPNLSALRYTAMASVLITCWTGLLIVLFYSGAGGFTFEPCGTFGGLAVSDAPDFLPEFLPEDDLPCNDADFDLLPSDFLAFGRALPVFIFGFTCQQNIFTILNETRNASKKRVDHIIRASYGVAGATFAAAAFFGTATYGNKIQENILKSYPQNTPVELTRVLFSLLVVFSYPLQAHPCRTSVLALLRMVRPLRGHVEGGAGAARSDPDEERRFRAVTLGILLFSFGFAVSVERLGVILSVVGATGSTMVSYILPGLIYIRCFPRWHLKRYFAMAQLTAGLVIMPICLAMIFA